MWWTQKALGLRSVCTGQRRQARSARPPGRSWTRLRISVPEPESRGGGANTGSQEGAGLIRASSGRTTQLWLRGDLNRSGQEWAGQPVGRPLLTWAEFGVLQRRAGGERFPDLGPVWEAAAAGRGGGSRL